MSDEGLPPADEFEAGSQVAGYLLEQLIGRGGMASVFRAHDERLGRRVALKILSPGQASDDAFRQRFIRESRTAAAVDHPNIIPIFEAGATEGGSLFIAMRYVQGGDVGSLLRRDGRLVPALTCSVIAQVAAGLDAAHGRGMVHRDVKPGNILLDSQPPAAAASSPDPAAGHVYLSDFGISKHTVVASHLTSSGEFVGTLDYVAPEQIEGRPLDGRADQYALACTCYELLSGAPPFRREHGVALIYAHLSGEPAPLTASRPDLPDAVDRVLARALAKHPGARYPTCRDFAADLTRALGQSRAAAAAAGPTALSRPGDPAQREGGPHDPGQREGGPHDPAQREGGPHAPGQHEPGRHQGPSGQSGLAGTWALPAGQGWPQQPPTAAQRRGRKWLVVTAMLAVILLAGGAAAAVFALRPGGSLGGGGPGSARLQAGAPCMSSSLRVSLGPVNPVQAVTNYPIVFLNAGQASCTLEGYPGVTLVGHGNVGVGAAALHGEGRPEPVTLPPGAMAHAELQVVQTAEFTACNPQRASALRVIPPGGGSATELPLAATGCRDRSAAVLNVSVVEPGAALANPLS